MRVRNVAISTTITALLCLSLANPARAAISDSPAENGNYVCSTSGTFTVLNGEVTDSSGCAGAVVIPYGITSINTEAFHGATGLTAVTISMSVVMIGEGAFKGTSLSNLAFMGNVPDVIGADAFDDIGAQPKVYVSDTNSDFGVDGSTWNGFEVVEVGGTYPCVTAGAVTGSGTFTVSDLVVTKSTSCVGRAPIPFGVDTIGDNAFFRSGVTAVTLPESLTTIGSTAFARSSLRQVTIPGSVSLIDDGAFRLASSLSGASFTPNSSLTTIGAFAFESTGLTSISIPDSVSEIGSGAFQNASSLESVAFSETSVLSAISDHTFRGTEIASIHIPQTVSSIGRHAFFNVSSLETVTFDGVPTITSIGARAFQGTSITGITIPASITSIALGAFALIPELTQLTFAESSSITTIGANAFQATGLTTIAIPASVSTLGNAAFLNAVDLVTVTIADGSGLGRINNSVFQGTSLSAIRIPPSVMTIGAFAFQGTALEEIEIPAGVTTIGISAFRNISALSTVTFVETPSLQSIGATAFQNSGLVSMRIPASVTSIGPNAFSGSAALTSVMFIGDETQYVGTNAFANVGDDPIAYVTETASGFGNTGDVWKGLTVNVVGGTYACVDDGRTSTTGSGSITVSQFVVTGNGGCEGKIIIPEGVMAIGDNSLSQIGVTSVVIASTVTTIGLNAFYNNASLTSVTFAGVSQLHTIEYGAFNNNNELSEITIPPSVVSIGTTAFYPNSKLATVTFSGNSKLRTIGNSAFQQTPLTAITIPETVTTIGENAFLGTTALRRVTFAGTSRLTTINNGVFQNSGIRSISIPPSVTRIGDLAFYDTPNLSVVSFPGNSQLNLIGPSAFQSSRALSSITIPASVTELGNYAFYDASNLARVSFRGNAPATVGESVFAHVASSASAYVLATATGFGSAGDTWNGLTVVEVGGSYNCVTDGTTVGSGTFTVLNSVVTASSGCTGLANIPQGVISIASGAFNDSNITAVIFPSSVTSIGEDAFFEAHSLNSVTFASGAAVESIGRRAFSETALFAITIPSSVQSIGQDAFASSPSLELLTFDGDAPTEVGTGAFLGLDDAAAAYVTNTAIGYGDEGSTWNGLVVDKVGGTYDCMTTGSQSGTFNVSDFVVTASTNCAGELVVPQGVKSIAASAFQNALLTSVTIPASVVTIGDNAFNSNSVITEVLFIGPSRLQSIGAAAFIYNSSLTSIAIPDSVTTIGELAFAGASVLEEVSFTTESRLQTIGNSAFQSSGVRAITIPRSVVTIGNYAFGQTSSLGTINFASDALIETIGANVFEYSGLTSVRIPSSVTSIGNFAFFLATSLATVTFASSSNLTSIGQNSFQHTAISSITIPASVDSLGDYAFYGIGTLSRAIFLGNAPTTIGTEVFNYASSGATAIIKPTATGFGETGDPWDYLTVVKVGGDYNCITDGSTTGSGTFTVTDLVVTTNAGCAGRAEIPDGVISIAEGAFENSEVVSVSIPSNVLSIGARAFAGSESLGAVTFIGNSALESIGTSAFSETSLAHFTMPASVSQIGVDAFASANLLSSITFMGNAPSQVGAGAFSGTAVGATAYVTETATGFGADDSTWNGILVKKVGGTYSCLNDGAMLGSGTFTVTRFVLTGHSDCTGRLEIPLGVVSVANDVIQNSAVTSVVVPASVNLLGSYSFYGALYLSHVTFYGNAPSGSDLFASVPPNAKAIVLNTATGFGNTGDLYGGLTVTRVGGTYECLDDGATTGTGTFTVTRFVVTGSANCAGRAEIPFGTAEIADGAFEDSDLISVTIPSSVASIGQDAFKESSTLEHITFTGSAPSEVGDDAFDGLDADVSGYQSETATGFGDSGDPWNGITVVRIGGGYACTTDGLTEGSGTFTVAQFVVTAHTDCTGRVDIPKAVTSIAAHALQSSGITSLVIPTSLKSVGDQALNGVGSLISVTFHSGSNLQTIGASAFQQTGITSIVLPASLESISNNAFWADSALTSVTFADNSKLNSIGNWAFESSGLTAIKIPASVELIGVGAFYNSPSLESVKFAAGSVLEHIGESALRSIMIREITVPASVETIDDYAFYSSTQLARVTFLGDAPEMMGVEVFNGTATGSTAYVSDTASGFGESGTTWNGLNVASVGGSYDCVSDGLHTGTFTVTNLTVVSNESCEGFAEIPHGVQSIDDDAFENSGLDSVSIASTVVSIGQDSFSGSSVLEKIQFFGDAPSAVGVDAFDDVETGADAYVSNTATGFGDEGSIWNQLTIVKVGGEYACIPNEPVDQPGKFTVSNFEVTSRDIFCTNARIEIPYGVTTIRDNVFSSSGITSALISSSVKSIGADAFYSNGALGSIEFAESSRLETIGASAFRATAITSFSIPNNVISIGSTAFFSNTVMTSVFFGAGARLQTIGEAAFYGTGITAINLPPSVTTIGTYAFVNTFFLESLSFGIGSRLQTIGEHAFQSTGIASVTIPASVTSIGNYAFHAAGSLVRVTFLGNAPSEVGEGSFESIGYLATAYVSDTATGFGDDESTWNGLVVDKVGGTYECLTDGTQTGTFTVTQQVVTSHNSCAGLAEIPYGVYAIGSEAFKDSVLTAVTIPESVMSIEDHAFQNSDLTSVEIPASTELIGAGVFADADGLSSIGVADGSRSFQADNGVLFDLGLNSLVQYPNGKTQTSYTIPAGVETINASAFEGEGNLTSVLIPTGVVSIDDYAFQSTGLTSVTIPASVETIGGGVFAQASALTTISVSVGSESFRAVDGVLLNFGQTEIVQYPNGKTQTSYTIPVNVESIGEAAFKGASRLTTVTFPTSITDIGDYAFDQASTLVTLKYLANAAPTVGTRAFNGVSASAKLYIKSTATGFGSPGTRWEGMTLTLFFRITYNGNENTGGSVPIDALGFYIPNDSATVLSNTGSLTRTNFTFAGWNTSANGTGTSYAATGSALITVTGNITLYAKWTPVPVKAASTVKPTITGTATVGKKLTANKGTWTGTPAPTFTYQWYSCSRAITATTQSVPATCTRISGATATTLTLTSALKGKFIAVGVTGTSAGTTGTVWLSKTTAAVK